MAEHKLANGAARIDFQTEPARYRHWKLAVDGEIATLCARRRRERRAVRGLSAQAQFLRSRRRYRACRRLQRLRFEHPSVKAVLLRSAKNRVFCAGANIRMLAGASHAHKVNFCKFTNETRNAIEDASRNSGLSFICVINGTAAGGGYELALAADHIILVDDGSSAVALPELPLLAVLPGTGGLTRVTDKRKVRRDHADVFCTIEEGVKGKRAVAWRLVDEVVPQTQARRRGDASVPASSRGARNVEADGGGIKLTPLQRNFNDDAIDYTCVNVAIDRAGRSATITLHGPDQDAPTDASMRLDRARRRILAIATRARARRRDPAPAQQRIRDRHADLQIGRRRRPRAGVRCVPRRQRERTGWSTRSASCGRTCSSAST